VNTIIDCLKVLMATEERTTMSFDHLPVDPAEERIDELLREADHERLVQEARRGRRQRAGLLRRLLTPRLAATARAVNDVLGAIISPAWPTRDEPLPPVRHSPGR
jgi:hypothetical protein